MPNQHKEKCDICGQVYSKKYLFPLELLRPSIAEYIKRMISDLPEEGYICQKDLRSFRSGHIRSLLEEERGEISNLDQQVIESLQQHDLLTENINKKFEKTLSFGERMADHIAKFGGSWPFIGVFFFIILVWMLINGWLMTTNPYDPYPFILLNLVLSCLAAVQAPIIMMSQNRHAEKDRMRDDDEYCTNLKTELEIRQLHSKMDLFMKKQWERLLEIQQIQIDLAEDILEKRYHRKHHPQEEEFPSKD